MKSLTKKTLDELAKTMSVISESEKDEYWGMYDNDCFWRCVSSIKGSGISEAAAATYAYNWYSSQYGEAGITHLSSTNDSAITSGDMVEFLKANGMTVGNDDSKKRIMGLNSTRDISYYRNNPNITHSSNHCLIREKVNSDGSYEIYDPQNNVRFKVTDKDEIKKFQNLNP